LGLAIDIARDRCLSGDLTLRGLYRGFRAAGFAGALMLGLLSAFELTEPLAKRLEKRFPLPPLRKDVLVWPSHPTGQFRCYLIALGMVFACVAIFALGRQTVRRRRRLALAIDGATLTAAVLGGFIASPFLGVAALALTLPLTALLLPHASAAYLDQRQSAPRILDTWAVIVESSACSGAPGSRPTGCPRRLSPSPRCWWPASAPGA
jgi:hypothetical protein